MGGRASRIVVRVAMVSTATLSASLLVYVGVLWQTVRAVDDVHTLPLANLRPPPAGRPSAPAGRDNPVFTGQNLLIVGNDDRSGRTDAEVRELKMGPRRRQPEHRLRADRARAGRRLPRDVDLVAARLDVHIPATA